MFIADELAYDKFHKNHNRIYRVTTHLRLSDVDYHEATSQFPAAAAIESEITEVDHAVRIFPQEMMLEVGEKKFKEQIIYVDQNFLDVFSFPLLTGDVTNALLQPPSVILTEALAKKYFGSEKPVGKNVLLNNQTLTVTGIVKDVPEQSHLKFDAIMPLSYQLNSWKNETGIEGRENKWFWTGAYTYLLLNASADAKDVAEKLPLIVNKYFPERYKENGRFQLQSLTDIHLESNYDAELEPGGSILYVQLFSIVAIVIMIVSTINLINLSYFKISTRVREVGIRKFLGQNTARIVAQLSVESLLTGLVAFFISLILCQIFLSSFNVLVQKNIQLLTVQNITLAGVTMVLISVICFLAIIRPAMRYAARSSGYLLLQQDKNFNKARFRNILMGLQVGFSFVLLAFSFIISSQVDFFKHSDLGFDKENIVVVHLNEDLYHNLEAFKNELKKLKDVVNITGADIPGIGYNAWRFVPEGGSYEKPVMLPFTSTDYSFLSTMNINLLMGEGFDPNNTYDSIIPFIINKRAAVELGWQDDPLGRTMEVFAPGTTEIMAKGKVIGMVDDYHFESLHRPVKPVVITVSPYYAAALIKLSQPVTENSVGSIAAIWKKFSQQPFEYEVLDEKLERLYSNETQLSQVIVFFTFIALYLTCYGLFAMSSLLFSRKLKEVAIRKVFGADQLAIVKQLYARYAMFNLIAIVVGLPVAIYLGDLWLETFQYKIHLTSEFFIKPAIIIFLGGLVSVSYYLGRVAWSNPVKFLRRE
jgi:putative ABC transport system permease protein